MTSTDQPGSPVVTVCGSINMDTFVSVERFPTAGETVIASTPIDGGTGKLGGKGANQAIAAARFAGDRGPTVRILATVGADAHGEAALGVLAAHGLDISGVTIADDASTGSAFIMNDSEGENIIVVSSGANTVTDPASFFDGVEPGNHSGGNNVLLAQGELTPEHSNALPALAQRLSARFVLNMAPVTVHGKALTDLTASADPLIVNETEAAGVLGLPGDCGLDEVLDAFTTAITRGLARSAVVTLGAKGALIVDPARSPVMVDSPTPERVVDTTGAGDAFCGTLASALALGMAIEDAVRLATAAGSLAVEFPGAAASYADRDSVLHRAGK